MKTLRFPRLALVAGCWLCWQVGTVSGEENLLNRRTIHVRDPLRTVYLRVSVVNGDIQVKGYEGTDIVVEARTQAKVPPAGQPAVGKENSDNTAEAARPVLNVREEDNRVSVGLVPTVEVVDLWIQVPTATHLRLHNHAKGGIRVEGVGGEIEAESVNGDINVAQAAETVVAHSVNGRIQVNFGGAGLLKPMSFTTVNGDILIAFPPKLKAKIRLESTTGKVDSEFKVKKQMTGRQFNPNKEGVEAKARPLAGTNLVGTINNGMLELFAKTLNGSICLQTNRVAAVIQKTADRHLETDKSP
jgi:hypothetical protein